MGSRCSLSELRETGGWHRKEGTTETCCVKEMIYSSLLVVELNCSAELLTEQQSHTVNCKLHTCSWMLLIWAQCLWCIVFCRCALVSVVYIRAPTFLLTGRLELRAWTGSPPALFVPALCFGPVVLSHTAQRLSQLSPRFSSQASVSAQHHSCVCVVFIRPPPG